MTNDNLAFIEAMESALATGDANAALDYLQSDVVYTVGARPPVRGIGAIIDYAREQAKVARWQGHTVQGQWRDGDTLIVEVISHFTRVADDRRISFPCTDIYRFRDGRIADWRVFADMSPFFETD